MTYNPNIPAATDPFSQSQSEIQTNFGLIDSATVGFGLDHVKFSNASNQGKHQKSTYIETSDPTTLANELTVYTKENPTTAVTDLYYRRESNGVVGQLTIFKAWGIFNGNSGALSDSFNITSVTRTGVGAYTVTMTNVLPNTNYGVLIMGQMNSAFTTGGIPGFTILSTSQFNIFVKSLTATMGADLNPVCFMVFQS